MEVKEMREKLSDVTDKIPRKNEDVVKLYNEVFDDSQKNEPVKLVSKNIYTYVGVGETPPHLIKFMGIQVFTRGQATEVTDPKVLAKIQGNPCFVRGEVTQEEIYENDEKAKEKSDLQREEDQKTQIAVERLNRKAG